MTDATTTDQQLRLFIEAIERLNSEKQGVQEDIQGKFAEAKSQGYDPKIMRQIIKLRSLDRQARLEQEMLLETYKCNLGID